MEARTLKYLAAACGATVLRGDPEATLTGVGTDSRKLEPGQLFVALCGERLDGHAFLEDAVARGAAAVLVEESKAPMHLDGPAVLTVKNPRHALGRLAARYRRDFELPCVAVGGSNGKTSTKELIAAVLAQKYRTLKSEASFNNDIGVPHTLLSLEAAHQTGVFEIGTNHPGELAPLMWMIQPCYGVITSLGREHLEFFGDLAGVAEEEGWLAELLPYDGKLFVNGDSPEIHRVLQRTRATVVKVGFSRTHEIWVRELRQADDGTTFWINSAAPSLNGEYRIHLLGRHQVVNALLAIAVGAELGLNRAEIRRGLLECQPARMRLQMRDVNGVRVLDDSYNANTDSMLAALETLHDLPCAGRRVAVLGDMAEVGAEAASAHAEVARRAAELGVSHLFAVGKMATVMGMAARAASLPAVREFPDSEAAGQALKGFVREGDLVLVKASRSSHLERVREILETDSEAAESPA